MVWTGGGGYDFAEALLTLLHQLEAAYPDTAWQTSPQTGTIGDAAHFAEGSASDHNPWLNNTVRALDVANVANGPDCEALFDMANAMYAAHDPRVYPNGYAIFRGRITDWDNPGQWHTYTGSDPHELHCHISVSQNPASYESAEPWPLAEAPLTHEATELEEEMKGYLCTDGSGNHWVIAYDLSSRRQVTLAAAKGLAATGKYDKNPGFDQVTLSRIPVTK